MRVQDSSRYCGSDSSSSVPLILHSQLEGKLCNIHHQKDMVPAFKEIASASMWHFLISAIKAEIGSPFPSMAEVESNKEVYSLDRESAILHPADTRDWDKIIAHQNLIQRDNGDLVILGIRQTSSISVK